MIVCLDTCVFLQIFGRKQPYYPVLRAVLDGRVSVVASTAILLEYEELTVKTAGSQRWQEITALLEILSRLHGNILRVEPHFNFG